MHRLPVLKLLLEPSLLSGLVVLAVSIGVTAIGTWSYIQSYGLFYEYLFGPEGIKTMLLQGQDRLQLARTILGSPLTYYLFVLCAGVATGLTIYAVLRIWSALRSSGQALLHSSEPADQAMHHDLLIRLLIRLLSGGAWVCFIVFFVKLIIPFAISLIHIGVGQLSDQPVPGAGALALATVVLAASLHAHIIFLRILLLRYRVFGGAAVITEEKMHTA